jgi:hypothetical protein
MGNASATVHNDTNAEVKIHVFNYADALRTTPRQTHNIAPGCSVNVEASAHGSGLIVATDISKRGKHIAVSNGSTLEVSRLMTDGDNNPFFNAALAGVIIANPIAFGVASTVGVVSMMQKQ